MTSAGAAEPSSAASERLALALQVGRIGTWHWDFVTGRIDRDAAMDELLGIEARSRPQPSRSTWRASTPKTSRQ